MATKQDSQKVASVIQKNDRTQIRLSLDVYKGHEFISLREFYLADGDYRPSSKGFTLPLDTFEETASELIKGIQAIASMVNGGEDN